MNRQLSFAQYRAIDLAIWAGILAVVQWVIQTAATVWFPRELYVVSPVAAIVAIVMMRWGPWAILHAALGGAVFALSAGGNGQHFLIFALGNMASLAALLILLPGKEKVRENSFLSLMFALAVQLSMLLGRAAMALLLGASLQEALGFITTDILSVLFTLVVIWIARRADGLFEDQKHYLLRLERERQQRRERSA